MAETLRGYAVLPINCLMSMPFPSRFIAEDPELDDLTESVRTYGVLEPIIARPKADGIFEIVMGERRVKAAKKAGLREIPAIIKQLSDEEAVVLQFTENIHRKDLSDDEKSKMLAFLSTLTVWSPKQLAEKLKRSYTWVMLYLPDEFKNEEKAKAGQKGGEARAAVLEQAATNLVARSELEAAERKMLLHRTQCQDPACLRFVPDEEIRYRNEKPYCLKCVPFIKEIKPAEPEEKPVSPKSLDTPEQKLARMHPQKSAFEERVVNRFRQILGEMGFGLETDREFCVVPTVPDAYVPELNGLAYIDGPVHTPKREDKDEQLRELLKKHHDELNIQGFRYRADSKAEEERVLKELQKWAEGLNEELQKWKIGSTKSSEETTEES